MKEKHTLTTGEVAQYCGVNFRTVIRWIKRGHLKAFQLPGRGDNRVEVPDFLSFLKKYRMAIPEDLQQEAEREEKKVAKDKAKKETKKPGKNSQPKVLVVDDDERMASSIRRALTNKSFEVQTAYDGFRAGVLLGTFQPDVMTLDLEMPNMHGMDVIRFVRSDGVFGKVKILVVSALHRERLAEAVKAGADDMLEKPFSNDVLIEKVKKLAGVKK